MAHIEKRGPHKWRARYIDPNGRERSKTFLKRIDAERFIIETESAKTGGSWVDPRAGSKPLGELAEELLAGRIDLRAASRARDATYMRRHVLPRFGAVPLSRISRQDVQEWVNDLSTKLAPATVHACHRLLSGVLREAVEARLIPQSPSRKVRLPRLSRTEQRFLTGEGRAPRRRINPEYRALVYSAAYLGCRWSELVGLHRENLHLLNRQVRIVGTLEEVAGRLTYIEEMKTSASRRTLTLPPFLADILAKHLEHSHASELVFVGRDGAPLRRSNFNRRHWKPAVEAASLDLGLRFHDLRHTCAALLIARGGHPKEVQARLGHASIKTTLDVYGHLMPGLGAQLDQALEEAREEAWKTSDGLETAWRRLSPWSRYRKGLLTCGNNVGGTGIEPVTSAV